MRKRKAWLVAVMTCAVAIVAGAAAAVEVAGPWVSSADPAFTKIVDLPDNIHPSSENRDCEKISTRYSGSSTNFEDCVIQTAYGLSSGQGTIFTGSSEAIPIIPPNEYIGLYPIPGQGLYYTYSSAPIRGLHIHFYRTIWDKVNPIPQFVNGHWQYKMTGGPDFSLRDSSGGLITINPNTLIFSPNGNWMVTDAVFRGFIRVNMATFDIKPFRYSVNQGSDYRDYPSQIGMSSDGRYVALKPGNESTFKIYDVENCEPLTLSVKPTGPQCPNRDYWPYLSSQVPGLRSVYQPRFTNENQLTLSALYGGNTSTQFKVAQYILTAPGVSPTGTQYLGMGDSYASGQGAFNYLLGTDTSNNKCHLSALSYPYLLSSGLFSDAHSVACSGAKIRDIIDGSSEYEGQVKDGIKKDDRKNINDILFNYSPGYIVQKDFLHKYNPQALTLSVGGNDIGYADVVKRCVMPAMVKTTCFPTYEDQKELTDRILAVENKLRSTYKAVSSPGRRVYIIGYPQIVASGGNCANNVHLDEQEIELFIGLTNTINQVMKRAADSAGVQFVDVSNAFDGHRMCETRSSDVAVNGFTVGNDDGLSKIKFIGAESYHPNALGHELLKQAILGLTNNLKKPMPAAVSASPDPSTNLPFANAPKTGRPVRQSVSDTTLVPDTLPALSAAQIQVNASTAVLRPSTPVAIRIGNDTTNIGAGTSDANGTFSGTITLPPSAGCGLHTLHVYAQNAANQPIDIVKEVYLSSPDSDCDQDGLPDDAEPCGPIEARSTDTDRDGVDDACDSIITEPPIYSVYLTGSSIHAVKDPANSEVTVTLTSPPSSDLGTAGEPQSTDIAFITRQTRKNFVELALLTVAICIMGRLYILRTRTAYVRDKTT